MLGLDACVDEMGARRVRIGKTIVICAIEMRHCAFQWRHLGALRVAGARRLCE